MCRPGGGRQAHGCNHEPEEAALVHDPRRDPAVRSGPAARRDHRRRHPGGARDAGGHGLHEDRRDAGHHRPLHPGPADGGLRDLRLVAPPRRGGRLGDGRRHGDRSRRDRRRRRPGSPQWVAMAGLSAIMCARLHDRGPDHPARLHRQLPVPQRPHRLPDRRRHPGRAGPGRRAVRGQRGQRHDPREVRQRPAGDRGRRVELRDPGGLDHRPCRHRRPRAGQQEDPGRPHRRGRDDRRRATSSTSPPAGSRRSGRSPAACPRSACRTSRPTSSRATSSRSCRSPSRCSSSSWPSPPRRRGRTR